MVPKSLKRAPLGALALALLGLGSADAFASHSWGNYHWARQSNPFTVKLGDNVSSGWDAYLATTSGDWSKSTVLDTTIVAGSTTPRTCKAKAGMVQVCNERYGNNGWLGVASIWASGSHITQGTVKVNDSYFNTSTYNTPAWKNLVMCQEVGHTFGLDHQDETFDNANLGTCMDYTNNPSTNQHPNQHDYDQLQTIYQHLDTSTTVGASIGAVAGDDIDTADPRNWGRLVRVSHDGRNAVYELDLGNGHKIITFVIFALEAHGNRPE